MIKVKVPATSANMGPGFDTMGIALNIYNYFFVEETKGGLEISGCEDDLCNENNLVYKSMVHCFNLMGYKFKGLKIRLEGDIPLSRGFGSSATCIIGGILAANTIAGNPLNKEEVLDLAISIEGHPDNVAPALLGSLVLSTMDNDKVIYNRLKIAKGLKFCALVPDFTLSTRKARAVLPKTVSYKDAVFNLSRSSLLVSALMNGNFNIIPQSCQDRLHQPYRSKLIPSFDEIFEKSKELNSLATYLSGAGPSIMVILRENDNDFVQNIGRFLEGLPHKWKVIELEIDEIGAVVENI
jgi:homoserine kinase